MNYDEVLENLNPFDDENICCHVWSKKKLCQTHAHEHLFLSPLTLKDA